MDNYLTLREHFLTLPEPFRSKIKRSTSGYLSQSANHMIGALSLAIAYNWGTEHTSYCLQFRSVVKRFESKSVLNE